LPYCTGRGPGRIREEWHPDVALAKVVAGLLNGKSIGFLVNREHAPTAEEIKCRPEWVGVKRVLAATRPKEQWREEPRVVSLTPTTPP
jgi:hypothetical protein